MSKEIKVLVGVDGGHDGDRVFDFYTDHFHLPEHQVLLVYVVKPLTISSNEIAIHVNDIREKSMNEEKIKVKNLKDNYEEKMRSIGIKGKINIIYYSKKPGKIICEMAQQERCQMVVIGNLNKGKGNVGSITEYILRKTSCAVLIVRLPDLASGPPDSLSKMKEFAPRRGSKDPEPRLRRISCPVVRTPPLDMEGEACRGATAGDLLDPAGRMLLDVPKPSQQRRHSAVSNLLQHLTLQQPGRKKRFASHGEEGEVKD